jgi:hypothetical protein
MDRVVVAAPAYKGLRPSAVSANYIGIHPESIGSTADDMLGFITPPNGIGVRRGNGTDPSDTLAKQFQPQYQGVILQRQAGRLPQMQYTAY